MFSSDISAADAVNAVRGVFRAHIPESNAWAEPNLMSVISQTLGALAVSALREARNGIDARVMPDTAEGVYLDALAARPPFNTFRQSAQKATGCIDVAFPGVVTVLTGEVFARSDGEAFVALCDATLALDGTGEIKVEAVNAGTDGNSVFGYPFTDPRGTAAACADGIGGGSEVESDDDLRNRLYSLIPDCNFGSLGSIERLALAAPRVRSAIACEDAGTITVYVATSDPSIPTQIDVDTAQAIFDDPCRAIIGTPVTVSGVTGCEMNVIIRDPCPSGVSSAEIEAYLDQWIDDNDTHGITLTPEQVNNLLAIGFPNANLRSTYVDVVSPKNCVFIRSQVRFE